MIEENPPKWPDFRVLLSKRTPFGHPLSKGEMGIEIPTFKSAAPPLC